METTRFVLGGSAYCLKSLVGENFYRSLRMTKIEKVQPGDLVSIGSLDKEQQVIKNQDLIIQ